MMRARTIRYAFASFVVLAGAFPLASCVSGSVVDGTDSTAGSPGSAAIGNSNSPGTGPSNGGSPQAGVGGSLNAQGGATANGGFGPTGGDAPSNGGDTNSSNGGSTTNGGSFSSSGGSSNSGNGGSTAGGAKGMTGNSGQTGTGGRMGAPSMGGAPSTGGAPPGTGGSQPVGNGTPLPRITGSSGFTTRYWDCCKPACAWPASQATQSCDQNNSSQGKGNNTASACGGGNAFMCYDYEPWVDTSNPSISYAFAAASGGNYVCGRCFEIQFNGTGHNGVSNGLSDKTMYLQVVNNGGVADDQFDLLVPGGGVGALNACSKEWGSGTDLGMQFGGLYSECKDNISCTQAKCATAFAGKPDLLAGCNWFLTWFTGGDNPNITFKQVSCPAPLTAKSGMSG